MCDPLLVQRLCLTSFKSFPRSFHDQSGVRAFPARHSSPTHSFITHHSSTRLVHRLRHHFAFVDSGRIKFTFAFNVSDWEFEGSVPDVTFFWVGRCAGPCDPCVQIFVKRSRSSYYTRPFCNWTLKEVEHASLIRLGWCVFGWCLMWSRKFFVRKHERRTCIC